MTIWSLYAVCSVDKNINPIDGNLILFLIK